MDGHFSNLLRLLENGKKSDSFADHFEQHFNYTTSRIDLGQYMTFKLVKQIIQIGAMKTFTKLNCNICKKERLTILKKLCDKRVTIKNKNSEIYKACRKKRIFVNFA